MKISCWKCGTKNDVGAALRDEDFTAILTLSGSFGRETALVWAYIELFGVLPLDRNLKKVRLIMGELRALFDAGSFKFQKQEYTISHEGIAEALNTIVHRHWTDRMQNHNYFKKIMIAISERESGVEQKRDEEKLRMKERDLQFGAGQPITDEERQANIIRVGDILKGITG
ncbi:MAG: hypothetical protein JXA07_04075 [Spirochaetes bacterium]|nr:hypothetical protein [Spirochaetota bacterium]